MGYGDAQKFKKHIALLPMKPQGANDNSYKGSEYMNIYPHIAYFDGTDLYKDGTCISRGYYVCQLENDGSYTLTSLADWFNDK